MDAYSLLVLRRVIALLHAESMSLERFASLIEAMIYQVSAYDKKQWPSGVGSAEVVPGEAARGPGDSP
jgi:hypothetical protein